MGARAAVSEIRRAVPCGRLHRLAHERIVGNRLLLSGAQGVPDPHPARAGRGRGGQDQPVHQGDREPGGMDHAAALVRRHHRSAALRRAAAAAAGAGDHRAFAARLDRARAAARLAPGHGCGGKQGRLLQGPEVRRSRCAQGLLRTGLFSPGVRALHDAGADRHAPRCRRERRRGQSQAHLGRDIPDQGGRARAGLSGRCARAS